MASTEASPHPLHLMLPQLGTDEDFAALRELLRYCDFNNEGICKRLEISSIVDFQPKCDGRKIAITMEQPIDAMLRLVLDGEFVPKQILDAMWPAGAAETMGRLGLLARDPRRPGELFSTVTMYPAEGFLLLLGDRPGTPDGSPYQTPLDVVYPGVIENTRHFLATLPQTPCEALLDLGTGSGVAALSASRYARHAWGVDIAGRSARFAEFNRRMNRIESVTILQGDMYEPVKDLTFDRIVTHPPYVPAPKIKTIFSDGGVDGEEILQRAIEGLPRHLRTGGRFHTLVLGADCEEEAFETRIRKWLGSREAEFDLVMVSHSLRPPGEFVARAISKGKVALENLKYWTECWNRRKVQFLFYGSILIRRHEGGRPAFTARVQSGELCAPEYLEWLLNFETESRGPSAVKFLLDAHPHISPGTELHVLHRLQDGRFAPEAFAIESKLPFVSELRCGSWLVALVSECDGAKTWRDHFERARQEALFSPETTEEEFADVLRTLVSQGILRLRERPLPAEQS